MNVKKCWVIAVILLLAGCSAPKDYETMSDVYNELPAHTAEEIAVFVPQGAQTLHNEDGSKIYLCDGFSIQIQNLPAGDLDRTLRTVSGFSREQLQIIERTENDHHRIECVWAAAGEGEDQIGRAVILDDGVYHYALTLMGNASDAGELAEKWRQITASFTLGSG